MLGSGVGFINFNVNRERNCNEFKKTTSTSKNIQQLGVFEFYIKRGVINDEDIEEIEVKNIIDECKQLCLKQKNKEAVEKLYSILTFEMDWDNCDGDPSEILFKPESIDIKCNQKNSEIKLGVQNSNLMITAKVTFEAPINEGLEIDDVQQWLDDNSAYAAGYVDGGWSYLETDGDNLNIVSIK